jgi:hypothetical protein
MEKGKCKKVPFYILPITFYIKTINMKLSTLTIGALIIFSTNAIAQTPKEKEKAKTKTTATKEDKTSKAKQDSVKTSKNKNRPISHDYCPPCGMG